MRNGRRASIRSNSAKPHLQLDDLLRLKWALGSTLALLSVWSVFIFDLNGIALLPFVSLAIIGTGWRPDWSERIPARVWKFTFPVLMLFVAADYFFGRELLATLIRLNLLLITIRAVAPRNRREDLQLVVLCLFLLVVAGVLTVSLAFAAVILAFVAIGLVFLLLVTLGHAAGVDNPAATPGHWTRLEWNGVWRRAWRAMDARFAALSVGLFLAVVALASGMFLALPRFKLESAVGLLNLQTKKSLTGFSDSVSIGDVTDLTEDTTTAVRLETSQPSRLTTQGYWRMVALDAYENGSFRVSRGVTGSSRPVRIDDWEIGDPAGAHGNAQAPTWVIYLEPGVTRFLPLTGPYERLRVTERQPMLTNAFSRVVSLRNEPQKLFAYRVEGMAESDRMADPDLARWIAPTRDPRGGASRRPPPGYPQTLRTVPTGPREDAVLSAQVAAITGGAQLRADEFASRAMAHLARRHRYAMRSTLPAGDADPFVRWLDSDTPGHCELFAGGFALLARKAGFPARLVTGFRGGVWNDFEGYLMLRNADAHAWCELYDVESGHWMRVDPTPSSDGTSNALAALAGLRSDRSWSARLDSMRLLWYRRIVNFDATTQAETTESLRAMGKRTLESAASFIDEIGKQAITWVTRPWGNRRTFEVIALAVAGAIAAWLAWRWRTRWRWTRSERRGRVDPIRREAGRWLARFAEHDVDAAPEVQRDLQRLRFGPADGAGTASRVFANARREWRQRGKRTKPKTPPIAVPR